MEGYHYHPWYYAEQRHHEYKRIIHDLSQKLTHENVQSISFLRHSSTDCYDYPPCAHFTAPSGMSAPAHPLAGPTNLGLQVLEQLWKKGVFNENNLEPLIHLLREIGRHDLANECMEKSAQLVHFGDTHRSYRVAPPPPPNIPHSVPPTLFCGPIGRDGVSAIGGNKESTDELGSRNGCSSEKTLSSNADLFPKHQDATAANITATTPISVQGSIDSERKSSSQASQSVPTQSNFEDSLQKDASSSKPVMSAASDAHQLELEDSVRDVHVTFTKMEFRELLQYIGSNPHPTLKEKLTTAASVSKRRQRRRETEHHAEILLGTHAATPKVIPRCRRKLSSDVKRLDNQTDAASHLQTPQLNPEKPILCHQKSFLHVRSIDTPIPAPLTPQPQRSHKKLEACSSNSSTDSGLSQCQSHRSSTVSNRSSSVFLSEDEDDQKVANEGDNVSPILTGVSSKQQHGDATKHSESGDRCEKGETRHGTRDKNEELSSLIRGSDGQEEHISVKCKPRRQSETTSNVAVEKRQKHEMNKGHHHLSRKRNRAISLPELPPLNAQSKTGMTIDWRIPRDDFIDPIFHHKNKVFEKKCRFSTGSGSSILNVQLAIRLYPNGINWDQGSYSTLKIEITSTSRPPPPAAYIQLDITGYDCHAGHVITSRQVEYPMQDREFLIPEFLSHEVIKFSHTKNFEFRATIKIKYLVCRDWVLVAPDKVGRSHHKQL